MIFRRNRRCRNLCPSPHPAYHGKQCGGKIGHEGPCYIKAGVYRHYWRQEFYERLGRALSK